MLADELDAALIDWHGEHVFEESDDGRAAVWRNSQTGSWTFVQYLDSGLACVLDHGQTWPPHRRSPELMAALAP
ncbi:S-adenosyl-L-homocysteine hydrolase [Tropicimonas sp. S265A]|uniref:S-adenosyl-L-homocysteine hydrolase n=1 Tax=Tropicimonas sp. S265A TaxID=3415134 RepID=UPI003C7CF221